MNNYRLSNLVKTAAIAATVTSAAVITAATPTDAAACGGTFCDAGPTPMPVDQEGENILFVMEEGQVEAHIQIQYKGNPEQFAWIVPVMALPEIEVGSDPLFDNLLNGTVPTFSLNTRMDDNCFEEDRSPGFACAMSDDFAAAGGEDGLWDEQSDEPLVVVQDQVGAYEYSVLQGGTVEGVTEWLDDNGYAQDPDAGPILQEYLDDDFMFVAFKLQSGAGIDEIHPVVVRYAGDEPCVPLRLTRIAAKEDMGVRVFFLGDTRVVPNNFRHVELNPLKIDWIGQGSNYEEVVTLAVDGEGADGHAFVTEYAGPSTAVDRTGLVTPKWDSNAFLDFQPGELTRILEQQNLIQCFGDNESWDNECEFTHPLIQSLLMAYLPPLSGTLPQSFYSCTSCYSEVYAEEWDMPGFAAAFEERIVGPGELALDRLKEHPYLTRMYTTISPGEMTRDPIFHENPDLPDVSNQWSATQVIDCEGPDRLELSGGQVILADEDDRFPEFDEMSYARRVQEIAPVGGPIALVDHAEDIDAALGTWNADHAPRNAGCDCRQTRRGFQGSGVLGLMLLLGLRSRSRRRVRRRD